MNIKHTKVVFGMIAGVGAVLVLAALGYMNLLKEQNPKIPMVDQVASSTDIIYENPLYGFRFVLPKTWDGYSVSVDTWTGSRAGDVLGEVPFTQGPVISIHHPKWTGGTTRQDIPIMVFTLDQWDLLEQEKFHIGAAPIGPSELGRNTQYVFALPARYNYSFPLGYEEVEEILRSHPLEVIEAR